MEEHSCTNLGGPTRMSDISGEISIVKCDFEFTIGV